MFATLGTGETVARALHALSFILLARAVGKQALGYFGVASVAVSYVLLFVMQGIDYLALRVVSRDTEQLKTYTQHIFGLRLALTGVALLMLAVYAALSDDWGPTTILLLILALTVPPQALSPRWSFQVMGQAGPLVVASLLSQLCFLLGVVLIPDASKVWWAAVALVVGDLGAAVYLWRRLSSQVGPLGLSWSYNFSRRLVRDSLPMTVSLILGAMIYNFDVVALSALGRRNEVGLYLACYRFVTAFAPVLTAIQVSIFPSLARSYPDMRAVKILARRAGVYSMAGFGLVAASVGVFAPQMLVLIFGEEFREGVSILRILVLVLPIHALRSVLRQVLLACHWERAHTGIMACAVATNVVLDLILVPVVGALGCAVSTVTSEAVLWLGSQMVISRRSRFETSAVTKSVNLSSDRGL